MNFDRLLTAFRPGERIMRFQFEATLSDSNTHFWYRDYSNQVFLSKTNTGMHMRRQAVICALNGGFIE